MTKKKYTKKKPGAQKPRHQEKAGQKAQWSLPTEKIICARKLARQKSIESILQTRTAGPFEAESISDFKDNLEGMTLTEMQELAVKAGVFPSGTKITLKSKLVKAFSQHSQGSTNVVQVTRPIVDPDSEQGKAFLRLTKGQ